MKELRDFSDKIISLAINSGCQYADSRAEESQKIGVSIENGQIENIDSKADHGIGVRILNKGVWGFFSISNPDSFEKIRVGLENTIKSTKYYAKFKKNPVTIRQIKQNKVEKKYPIRKQPTLDEMIEVGLDCDKMISSEKNIIKSAIVSWSSQTSKYFSNSEGARVIQNFTDTIMEMTAVAHDSGVTQSVNITEGGRGGMERILKNELVLDSANEISKKAAQLLLAKPTKEKKTKVVMNPDFVALLTHEILGHPSEADRVLGKEMAWAGGAWWKGMIGQKIGSESLTVFDDPTIEGTLGWYDYDDEGVKTKNTTLIEDGILKNHMQNRETAEIFDSEPTGNMRATNYRFMPLIRMACTCIAPGNWKQEEMIKEVKEGVLISNMKIPSIDMMRYNWSISCQYAQKIEKGEVTDLLRDVIVMDVAPDFFSSIDACGNDFTVRPITNCGKGDPMQSMIMGNGGPSIRGKATVKSVR